LSLVLTDNIKMYPCRMYVQLTDARGNNYKASRPIRMSWDGFIITDSPGELNMFIIKPADGD
jgi:hypothetical protein